MKHALTAIGIALVSLLSMGQGAVQFSKQAVLSDLETLRNQLQAAHFQIFTYTTPEQFDSAYHHARESVRGDSLTLLTTTSLFQGLVSVVNNGHTEIDFPAGPYREYAMNGGTVFPLELAFEEDRALVRKNWSGNEAVSLGAELVSINGQPIASILDQIYPLVSAERNYFKLAKIEVISFPRLYWQAFGEQAEFTIQLKTAQHTKTLSLPAIPLIADFEMKRNEVLNAHLELKFLDEVALLNPGNFAGNEEDYQAFIDSAFRTINQASAKTLIIDLRNNAGGDNSFSDYLVSYFATKPFHWASQFELRTSQLLKEHTRTNYDTTEAYFRAILDHENGRQYSFSFEAYQPVHANKRYTGKVYVLVNRQTHSQAAVTAAQIQDYGFGKIVGEETAEYPNLLASQFHFQLPNTGINVKIAKGKITRVSGITAPQGVIPDLLLQDHLLDEEDEILQGLIQHLSDNLEKE